MPTLTVDGRPLHYRDEGQGPPVLLLHAFPLHSGAFDKQVRALSGRYRFLLPDLRGFGQSALGSGSGSGSSGGDGATSMTALARDALALLEALEIDSAVVGGVSMGGYASMALLREDAGRVRGLVLVDTQALADDEPGRQRREDTARALLKEGPELLVRTMLPRLVAEPDSEVGREVTAMIRAGSPEGLAAAQRGMALRHDSKDILARYAGPTLVVVGEKDSITPPDKARQMADLVSGARLEVIAGAAHLPNQEQPERFNAVLEQFLSGL